MLKPRKVYKCDKLSMEVLEEYPSASQAERENGLPHSAVSHAASKKMVSAGPFVWRYADGYDPDETFDGKMNRPMAALDIKTREVSTFPTRKDAAKALVVTERSISSAMCQRNYVLGRYAFKYAR